MRTARPALAILALAVGGFTIGTTEFMTMGVLPEIADGVDVSVPTAGHIISAYALGVVVGVPILAFFGAALPRRAMLVGLMVAYGAFNLISAVAPDFRVLTAARFLDGLPHGAFFGVASLVAASLVAPARRGRAVASVMLGLSVANVVGVPLATWLGQQAGWRTTYLLAAVLALVTAAGVLAAVPSVPGDSETSGRKEAREFFGSLQVWLTMAAGAIGFGGMFAVYSYIAKTVTVVGGLERGTVPLFVLALGLGMVVGTPLGGRAGRVVGLPQPAALRRLRRARAAGLLRRRARRLGAAAGRVPGDRHRVGAGREPAAAADGRRRRRGHPRRGHEPCRPQRRQRARRLARRPRDRRRATAIALRPSSVPASARWES